MRSSYRQPLRASPLTPVLMFIAAAAVVWSALTSARAAPANGPAKVHEMAARAAAIYMGQSSRSSHQFVMEWSGVEWLPHQSRRPEPPWDELPIWWGRAIDFEHLRAAFRSDEDGGGYERASTRIVESAGSIVIDHHSVSARSALLRFEALQGEIAAYSPLIASRLLSSSEARARIIGRDACDGLPLMRIDVARESGGPLALLLDSVTGEIRCTRHSINSYEGTSIPIEIRFGPLRSYDALKHPESFTEYEGGIMRRAMTLRVLDAPQSIDRFLIRPQGQPVPPAPAGMRDFRVQPLGRGVWLIGEGVMYQLFVEFDDFVVALDGSSGDVRKRIEAFRHRVPDKPVRYVLASHHHDDHLHGLDEHVALGAKVLAARAHRATVVRHLDADHADAVEIVDGERWISDGSRRMQIIDIGPLPHSEHLLVAWLPDERLLFEADLFVKGSPAAAQRATPNMRALHSALRDRDLNIERIVDPHTPLIATWDELETAVGAAAARSHDHTRQIRPWKTELRQ